MPSSSGISIPWRKLPSGMTSLSSPPSAVQSRRASSSSLSDCESQSAFFRPRSRLSRMIAATCRPLPQPVPSPSIQPRRKRTGSDRVSPSAVTKDVSISSPSSPSSLQRWTVSHWEPMRYSAARWREWASPANTTLSNWASDSWASVTTRSGSIGRFAGAGCGTAAMAADWTSGVGCSTAPGTRTTPGRQGA